MHILNNGNGIIPKFTWLMNHPNWSIVIYIIVNALLIYMACEFTDSEHSKIAFANLTAYSFILNCINLSSMRRNN